MHLLTPCASIFNFAEISIYYFYPLQKVVHLFYDNRSIVLQYFSFKVLYLTNIDIPYNVYLSNILPNL